MTNFHHHGKLIAEKNGFSIINCELCGFAHCFPIPEQESLQNVYAEEYYSSIKHDYIESVQRDAQWHTLTFTNHIKIMESFTAGRSILEIGSGPGFFLKSAATRGWKVQGFEPSRQAWQYSRQILKMPVKNAFFTEENAQGLGTFDAA